LVKNSKSIYWLSDVASSIIILVDINISERPVRSFLFGMYKVKNLAAMAAPFWLLPLI
jgi:divalent metal cation (Fe/Co/Zn/Cd) transporter